MRPVVSYEDITNPEADSQAQPAQLGPQLPSSAPQPPAKRRKKSHNQQQHQQNHHPHHRTRGHPAQYVQHWDEPDASAPEMNYGGEGESMYVEGEEAEEGEGYEEGDYEEEYEEEESRELTHEEVWDDSALIDAWNSAAAEYEAYHGKGKKWKAEPVKKSPLWYNVPPAPSKTRKKGPVPSTQNGGDASEDSTPVNFDTFIPNHDPSLASGQPHPPSVPGPDYAQYYLPNPPGPMVSQDEAFQRALSAMYWGGYWTAVYHCQRQGEQPAPEVEQDAEDGEIDATAGEENAEMEEDLVPSQR
ncbi:unnamed protein product [Somion occarium]